MKPVLLVKNEPWNDGAAAWLIPACDEEYPITALQNDCENGICSLFNVYGENGHVASMVMRIDDGGARELVVVAGGGYFAHGSLYKILTPYVEAIAAANGCKYLRGHTRRKGIGRLMQLAGWEQSEIIFRKQVDDGRKIQ